MKPSEYFKRQCWISFDPDESTLKLTAESPLVGADRIIWASDYPHPDAKIPGVVGELREQMEGLPDAAAAAHLRPQRGRSVRAARAELSGARLAEAPAERIAGQRSRRRSLQSGHDPSGCSTARRARVGQIGWAAIRAESAAGRRGGSRSGSGRPTSRPARRDRRSCAAAGQGAAREAIAATRVAVAGAAPLGVDGRSARRGASARDARAARRGSSPAERGTPSSARGAHRRAPVRDRRCRPTAPERVDGRRAGEEPDRDQRVEHAQPSEESGSQGQIGLP